MPSGTYYNEMNRKAFLKLLYAIPVTTALKKMNSLNHIMNEPDSTDKMPVLFLGHGSPMNAIEDNEFSRNWAEAGKSIARPRAILCVSAHWETRGTWVTSMEKPETIHDFGGFPQALYNVNYPAPGSPELAGETKLLVKKTEVGLDQKWGLDHGTWSVIIHMYPKADIPVIQLSLDYGQSAQYHYDLARELAALRKKGVLIIGSGNIVHNLGMVAWYKLNDEDYGYDWAREAKEKMKKMITDGDHKSLINYSSLGKEFQLSAPTPEHFLPLLYILALRDASEEVSFFNDKCVAGSLAMTSLKIR
jgi:4,5-DOPA dioxygenase extradiol